MLDTSKAEKEFGFKAKTSFEEGLRKTIDWCRKVSKGFSEVRMSKFKTRPQTDPKSRWIREQRRCRL
jgi:dTDP-D-glucose 4,6-dehydratase